MYNLLIVDDETLQANSLYEYITHECAGEYECLKAYSSKQALALASHTRIDIAVLDIEMPVMNGLELHEKLKTIYPHCHIIFLTAYDRFDYAYAAAQQHKTRLLLKAEGNDFILSMIHEESQALDQELLHMDELLNPDFLPGHGKNDFLRLILNGSIDNASIEQEAKRFHMPLNVRQKVMPILLCLNDESRSYTEEKNVLVRAAHFFQSWFEDFYAIMLLQLNRRSILFLVQPMEKAFLQADIKQELELFLNKVIQISNRPFSLALAADLTGWDSLSVLLTMMQEKLESAPAGNGEYICQLDHRALETANLMQLGDELVILLQQSNEEKLRQKLREGAMLAQSVNIQFSEFLFHQFERVQLKRLWDDWGYGYHQMAQFAQQLESAQNNENMISTALEFANGLVQKRMLQTCEEVKYAVRKTDEYIRAHYAEDISLADLARHVCLSSPYLSRIYKRETGMNTIEKIKEVRIKEAVRLLETTNMKIQDVAVAVGYNSSRYFNSVFRSIMGIKPSEYREEKQ